MAMEARLRHEMRGLAVHRQTRRLLCRPYHKFWHAGQRPEQAERELSELVAAPSLPVSGPDYPTALSNSQLSFAAHTHLPPSPPPSHCSLTLPFPP